MTAISIGDSWGKIVAGGGTPWPDLLGITNLCVSGSTAQEWADNKDGWLSDARAIKADTVIISLMGNDAFRALADGQVTMDETRTALASMRAVVTAMQPARIIVLLYADPFSGKDERAKYALPLLNGAIEFACLGLPVEFVAAGSFLTAEHFDGTDIHPKQNGHEAIAAALQEVI